MSVLIKCMEMPKEGTVITIYKLKNKFYASIYGTELCPLVEVPEPHGRLIDADALDTRVRQAGGMGNVEEECTEDFNDGVLFVLDYFVKNAPTVIPREDGENHEP